MEVVLVIAAACGIFIFLWLGRDKGSYSYHSSSYGARRICCTCDQVQHLYRFDIWGDTWWEPIGAIVDPQCKCHKDTK